MRRRGRGKSATGKSAEDKNADKKSAGGKNTEDRNATRKSGDGKNAGAPRATIARRIGDLTGLSTAAQIGRKEDSRDAGTTGAPAT